MLAAAWTKWQRFSLRRGVANSRNEAVEFLRAHAARHEHFRIGLGADCHGAASTTICSTPKVDVPTTQTFPSFQPDGPILENPDIECRLLANWRQMAASSPSTKFAAFPHMVGFWRNAVESEFNF